MKYILTLVCAMLTACGQSTNTPYLFDTSAATNCCRWRSVWAENGTNFCEFELVTNVVTQWLPIEREEGQRGARVKQIGLQVTNQVLTVIAYDKTNEVILKMLGREEWPSQKRVVVVPNQHAK